MSQRLRLVVALLHPQDENRFTLMYAPISKEPDYRLDDKDRYEYQVIDYIYDSRKNVIVKDTKVLRGNQVNIFPVDSTGKNFPGVYCGRGRIDYWTVAGIECVGICLEDQSGQPDKFIFNIWDENKSSRINTFRIMGLTDNKKVLTDKAFVDNEKYNGSNCILMIDTLYDSISKGRNLVGMHIRSTNFLASNNEFMYVNIENTVPEVCYNWRMSTETCITSGNCCIACEHMDDRSKREYVEKFNDPTINDAVNYDSGIVGYDRPTAYMLIEDCMGKHIAFNSSERNCCLAMLQDNFLTIVPGYKTMNDMSLKKTFMIRRIHDRYYGIACTAHVNGDCRRIKIPMLDKRTGELVHIEVRTNHIISSSTKAYYQPIWFGKDFILMCVELTEGISVIHRRADSRTKRHQDSETSIHNAKRHQTEHYALMIVDYEGNIKGIWHNVGGFMKIMNLSIYHIFKMADGSYMIIYRQSALKNYNVEHLLLHKDGGYYHFYDLTD